MQYCTHVPHNPSYWEIYLSKEHYDSSTAALGRDYLVLIKEIGNIYHLLLSKTI
ncbi:MAG: lytic polysaccharide monooxygenase [Rickettsiales endosymbiont of Dermacentor nuttalli]